MKKTQVWPLVLLIAVAAGTLACSKYPGFKKTDTGLYYKIDKVGDDTLKPKEGYYIFMDYRLTGKSHGKDTVLLDTKSKGQPPFRLQLAASDYKGDIYEGLKMMTKDDSATFILNVDSLFNKTFRQPRPPFLDSNTTVKFFIHLTDIQDPKQLMSEEKQKLSDYLKKNNITTPPLESGVYFIEKTAGKGPKIDTGMYVKLHFIVSLIDGKEVFSSRNQPEPFTYVYGQRFETQGFDEAVKRMSKGSRATVIVPSEMAYGERGKGNFIPPFSTVIYDIEIMDIQTKAQHEKEQAEAKKKAELEKANAKKNETGNLQKYLKEHKITAKPTTDGLYYIEKVAGTGPQATVGKKVSVHYTGTLLNGKEFDSSRNSGKPFEFVLGQGQVIKGWDEGIAMMKKGGRATLIVPSDLGYGEAGMGGVIPPYATLVFEVELVDVK